MKICLQSRARLGKITGHFCAISSLPPKKNELTDIYQMSEGIETRLKQAAARAENFEAFLDQVKTKRYTRQGYRG
jgi:predicted nucleotidyltransferase